MKLANRNWYESNLERISESNLTNKEEIIAEESKSEAYRFIELNIELDKLDHSLEVAKNAYQKFRQDIENRFIGQYSQTEIILRAIVDKSFADQLQQVFKHSDRLYNEQQTTQKVYNEYCKLLMAELDMAGGREVVESLIRTRALALGNLL